MKIIIAFAILLTVTIRSCSDTGLSQADQEAFLERQSDVSSVVEGSTSYKRLQHQSGVYYSSTSLDLGMRWENIINKPKFDSIYIQNSQSKILLESYDLLPESYQFLPRLEARSDSLFVKSLILIRGFLESENGELKFVEQGKGMKCLTRRQLILDKTIWKSKYLVFQPINDTIIFLNLDSLSTK